MPSDLARAIADAYRWQRRLGAQVIADRFCHIVADPAHPHVWDVNHVDDVTAETEPEIEAAFAAMDAHLAHTPWRVIHTDCFTPDAFLARLALDDFIERPVTIEMAFAEPLTDRGAAVTLEPVVGDADWDALQPLVVANHAERQSVDDLGLTPEFSRAMTETYRMKGPAYAFHLVMEDGVPVAYGACAAAPNGVGMIEDVFTMPAARHRGVARGMIAAFVDRLRNAGCHAIFLGASADDRPKRLYARLGFRPVTLSRTWVLRRA
jgi:GNAT superfamily N-acetyltransferase